MRKTTFLLSALLLSGLLSAQTPKREFRATWLATVWNIDWPKTTVTTTGNATQIAAQKDELTAILDQLVEANMNAICMQIRPTSDALYNSAYEPWSKVLTGTRGKNPGYDPLAFAVEEAHKRGLELHAWINPFRYETSAGSYGNVDLRLNHSEWILNYPDKADSSKDVSIIDPGNPNVRKHIASVIGDILSKYDIDGILFDDYFYAYSGTSSTLDSYSQNLWKPAATTLANWRRENVNATMKAVYDTIQTVKPWVRFGVAPFGIWSTSSTAASSYGLTLPSGITGMDAYNQIYCDPIAWLNAGTVDYVSPQLYWPTTSTGQDYDVLCPWWSNVVKKYSDANVSKNFHLYVSHSLSAMVAQSSSPAKAAAMDETENIYQLPGLGLLERAKITSATTWDQSEIGLQIDRTRSSDEMGAPGAIFYNTTSFLKTGFVSYLQTQKFVRNSLPPAMSWKTAATLAAPGNLALSGTILSWTHTLAARFAVYAYPKGTAHPLETSTYLCGIVYGKNFDVSDYSANLSNTTFAVCALDRYANEYEAAYLNAEAEEPPVEGDVKISKLWSYTQAASGYLLAGAENRSMAFYDGKLYIPNKTAGTFSVVNALNGKLVETKTLGTAAFGMHNLRITNDGYMLLGNSGSGSSTVQVKQSNRTTGGYDDLGSFSVGGRTDYFFTYGNFADAAGGYIVSLSNTNNKAAKVEFANSTLGAASILDHSSLPVGTSAIAIPADANSFYANTASAIPSLHSLSSGAQLEAFASVQPALSGVSGMNVFTFKGRKFMVTTADAFGSVEIFEITDGLAAAVKVCNATETLGSTNNTTYTVSMCSDVQTDKVMLYVMAPNNGIAAYTITIDMLMTEEQQQADIQVNISTLSDGIRADFIGTQKVELYHISGICIEQCTAVSTYSRQLPTGIYILRVGDKAYKIVK